MHMKPGLLISSPQLHDRFFDRSVVLMIHSDHEGALGLVINREGTVPLGAILKRLDIGQPPEVDTPTWWGGPVGPGTGFVLYRGHVDEEEGWNLGQEVAVSQSVERLAVLIQESRSFQLVLGYAGWGPGQLDAEIESGSWLFADIDATLVFDTPMAERYDHGLALLGLTATTVWMNPIDE